MPHPYKHAVFSAFVIFACIIQATRAQSPQVSYLLDNTQSGSTKNYVARDEIVLKPGFVYSASGSNAFSAKIDPYIIDTVPFPIQVLDGSGTYVVGGINSHASVSPSGAAICEIPIKVSPGTAGMTPQLSIVYNSQGADGLLGVGFSMQGLSSITRIPSGKRDGVIKPVNLDNGDKFSLDGNKLISISGSYGGNGTEYRTENNSFSKIISYTTTTTGTESFIVYTKSGLIYEYGSTNDSKFKAQNTDHIITWLLNKVTDTKDNYYTITYTQDRTNGEYRPLRIDYTGNNNSTPVLTPYCSIRFSYQYRSQTNLAYVKGNKSIVSKLLSQIEIYYEEEVIKKYTLEYNSPNYGKYLLSKITETGSNGEKVSPVVFSWYVNNDYKPTAREYDQSYYAQQFVKNDNEVYLGDFNGDGKTDFVATPKTGTYANKWGLFLANATGSQCSYITNGSLLDGFEKIYTGDFNGDGKTDIIQRRKFNNIYTNYYVFYSTGTGFSNGTCFFTASDRNTDLVVGDFNGDGASDVLVYYPGAKDYETFTSSFSGGVLTPLVQLSKRQISINWDRVEVGDFNGDGLTDLINLDDDGYVRLLSDGSGSVSVSTPGTWPKKGHHLHLGDFNGDGKTDMLLTGYTNPQGTVYDWSDWQVHLSTGVSFESHSFSKKFLSSQKNIFVGDINGDGKDDFCAVDKTNSSGNMVTMGLYISDGTGASFSAQTGISVYPTDKWKFYTGDFNGDGRNDFLCKSNNPPNGFSGYQLCNSITERDKLLKNVTDSYGNTTSFTYKSMTDQTVYSPHTDGVYPVSDFTGALPLVDKMTQPDGLGGTKNISYKYAGAKLHKQGKGFLGFSKFTVKDEQTGISSIAFYEYDPTKYAVGLKRTETRLSKNQYNNFLLSETDYTNTYREYNGYHSVPIFTYQVAASEEKHYELNSSSPYKIITSSYTYDDYGNALTTSQSVGNEYTVSSVNEYTNNTSSWFLGRLTKATVTKQSTGKPDIVRTSEFEYDPVSGMLTKEIVEPDNYDLGFSKTYEHDSYGNIEKSIITTNEETRQQLSVYNDKGRFVVEKYNPLGHKNSQTYDPRFGTITSQTDPNLLSVSTIYDSFGRPKLITGADGAKKVIAYRWCMGQGDEPLDALWLKYVEITGSPGTKVYYDKLGRELRTETVGYDSKVIWVDTEYNAMGQVSRQSDPYFKDETAQWTSFTYDELGRLKQKDLPNGAVIKVTYNGLSITTENPLQQVTTKRTNQQGQLIESTDDEGNSVTYVYDSAGNLIETYNSQGNVIKMEYDLLGNRTKLIDPELGTVISDYNAFGELISETDANSNQLVLEYDQLGRMTQRTETEGITTWVYDTGNCGIGRLATINGPRGYKQETEYDNLGRIITIKETIAGTVYTTTTQYDSYSRVLRTNYPSINGNGPVIRNVYNTNGYLSQVKDNQTGDVYWTANTMNARGQFEAITYGNGLNVTYQYSASTGQLIHQKTMTSGNLVQEWDYGYDAIGNLKRRTDYKRGGTLSESFDYDNLNRLIEVQNNAGTLTMTYDDLGNILTKSDVGEYHYNNPLRPYTVTGITPCTGSLLRSFDQRITYTSFDKVKSIAQNSDSLHLFYGSSYERIYADSYQSNVLKKRRTYVNKLYEQEKDFTTGNIRETFYIFGGDGLTAIRVRDTSGDHVNYVHKDHLGSIQCLTNEVGVLVQEFSYDAWGNRRDPVTLQVYVVVQTGLITDRGFTGHEHIDLFDLVNMNGRVYDPVIGRFISADPLIQDPENLQSLNRYAYCLNNPLIFIDPSGYSWLSDNWRTLVATGIAITVSTLTAGLGSGLGFAIIAGAAGGFAGGFSGALLCGADMGQALKAGAIGGVIGAATGFLNFAAGSTSATSSFGKILEKAGKHAFADVWMGGVKNAVYGGDLSPVRDMIGGALSSLGNGLISDHANSTALKVASSAVLGGTIAEIGGGKFANGAVTGAYSMLFNDMMHELREDKATKKLMKAKNAVETVNDARDALNGDEYAQVKTGSRVLSALQAIPKAVGKFLSNAFGIIDIYVFYMDNVAPMVDQSLQSEGKINPPKQNINKNLNPNYGRKGYWSNGRWHEE